MRRFYSLVFSFAFALGNCPLGGQIQGQWAATGTLQSGREFNAQVLLTSGNVLSMGGIDNNNILSSTELYSVSSQTSSLTGTIAEVRESFPAVVLSSGKVVISGGLGTGNAILSSAELYDPASGTWSAAASLSVARAGHTATLFPSGTVLVAGDG